MIAGSHRFGNLKLNYAADAKELRDEVLPAEIKDLPQIQVELAPGDLVLFHPLVVHGSNPNYRGARRLSLVSGFAAPGANHAKYPGEGSGERIVLP
jgi:ectoine hydroxylase-related dioxygenase (phytanoyl-CoA dioxygenase family)